MRVNINKRNIGINFIESGEAEIVVWSPTAKSIEIITDTKERIALTNKSIGYWTSTTRLITPGSLYKISVDGKDTVPDPASLSQPSGVHGYSGAFNLKNFNWTDAGWSNIQQQDYIIYELHTGTFTPQNNFEGIISKLDHLF